MTTATKTKVSIVIPVYNEEATVQQLVGLVVRAALPPGCTREVICVNDASKDGTAAKLEAAAKKERERLEAEARKRLERERAEAEAAAKRERARLEAEAGDVRKG